MPPLSTSRDLPPRRWAWITEWCDRQTFIRLAGSRGGPPSSSLHDVVHAVGQHAALEAVRRTVLVDPHTDAAFATVQHRNTAHALDPAPR